MVGGAVENQEDILPGKLSRQDVEKGLEARRIRSWHDPHPSPCMRAGVVKQKNDAPSGFLFAQPDGSYSVIDCDQADHELHKVLTPFGDGRLRTR